MPIQIRQITSLRSVMQRIAEYETRFNMSSTAFSSDDAARATVPEFDAIEWNFLLMQMNTMKEDDTWNPRVFMSDCKSHTGAVDTGAMYESVAA
jgi:hypothetical protein